MGSKKIDKLTQIVLWVMVFVIGVTLGAFWQGSVAITPEPEPMIEGSWNLIPIESDYELEQWTPQRCGLNWGVADELLWRHAFLDADNNICLIYMEIGKDGNLQLMFMERSDHAGWCDPVQLYP